MTANFHQHTLTNDPTRDPTDRSLLGALSREIENARQWWRESTDELFTVQKELLEATANLRAYEATLATTVYGDPTYKNPEMRKAEPDRRRYGDGEYILLQVIVDKWELQKTELERDIQDAETLRRELRHEMDLATAWLQWASVQEDEKHT